VKKKATGGSKSQEKKKDDVDSPDEGKFRDARTLRYTVTLEGGLAVYQWNIARMVALRKEKKSCVTSRAS